MDGAIGLNIEVVEYYNGPWFKYYTYILLMIIGEPDVIPKVIVGKCYPHKTHNISTAYKDDFRSHSLIRSIYDFTFTFDVTYCLFHEIMSILKHAEDNRLFEVGNGKVALIDLIKECNMNKEWMNEFEKRENPWDKQKPNVDDSESKIEQKYSPISNDEMQHCLSNGNKIIWYPCVYDIDLQNKYYPNIASKHMFMILDIDNHSVYFGHIGCTFTVELYEENNNKLFIDLMLKPSNRKKIFHSNYLGTFQFIGMLVC